MGAGRAAGYPNHEDFAFVLELHPLNGVGNARKTEFVDGSFQEVLVLVGVFKTGNPLIVGNADEHNATVRVGEGDHAPNYFFGMIGFQLEL